MNAKLAVVLLSGLSVGLSLSAMAVADGEPVGYMDWSYVMGESAKAAQPQKAVDSDVTVQTNFTKTPASIQAENQSTRQSVEMLVAETVADDNGLTLTYVDEAAPLAMARPESLAVESDVFSPRGATTQKCPPKQDVVWQNAPVKNLNPQTVAKQAVVEHKIDTRYVQQPVKVQYPITRQYPISVQYPVTVQRELTVEQPVVMQQPVIVKRPVVMQQAVTVQRPTQYIQQPPVVMQQQPTYIQQQPVMMPMQPTVQVQPQPVSVQPMSVMAQPMTTPAMQPVTTSAPAPVMTMPQSMSMTTTMSQQMPSPAQVAAPQMVQPVVMPMDNVYQMPVMSGAGYSYPVY